MVKAKWLYFEIPTSLKELSKLMLANQYSEESGFGFLLSNSTENSLSGRYIERVIQSSVIESPFGELSQIETVSYYICRFNWTSGSKLLCLIDPPRSLRKFTNCLHDMLGLGLVIAEPSVSPDQWLNEIEKHASSVIVNHISSFGIHTPSDSLARIAVTGHRDVRNDFYELIGSMQHKVDCIKFVINYKNGVNAHGELTKTGACKIKCIDTTFILDEFRKTLELSHVL